MRGRMVVAWGEDWRMDKAGVRKFVAVWAGSRQAPPWMRLLWHIDVSLYWPWVLLFHLFVWTYITQRPLGGAWGRDATEMV